MLPIGARDGVVLLTLNRPGLRNAPRAELPGAQAGAEALARRLAGRSPPALRAAKRAILAADEGALDPARDRPGFERLLDAADRAGGIGAFGEWPRPGFLGR